MMIVDSNTWADFFNGIRSPHVQHLEVALQEEEDLAIFPIIITAIIVFVVSAVVTYSNIGLHPDFGSGQYQGSNIGIPYLVVGGTQAPVSINFSAYGDESDPGPGFGGITLPDTARPPAGH